MKKFLFIFFLAAVIKADTSLKPYVPHQLVRPSADHTSFEVVSETISKIMAIAKRKISLISVVGPYHSGKSFLLNALIGRTNVFSVGPKTSPETMGIWVCRTDITLPSHPDVEIWFIDSEGFFGPGVSETYDAKIFTLAMLLGDEFIYNTVKIIDSQAVGLLEMLARRAQLFRVRSGGGQIDDSHHNLLQRLPHLTWVVEDFVQQDQPGGVSNSGWLESYLHASNFDEEEFTSNHRIPYLKKLFPSISVKSLFIPATTRQALADLSKVPYDKLTEEFRSDLKDLKKFVVSDHLDKLGEYRSTGEFGQSVFFLARALSKGLFPELPSLWTTWRREVIERSVEDAYMLFDETLSREIDSLVTTRLEFDEKCMHAKISTIVLFRELVRDFSADTTTGSSSDGAAKAAIETLEGRLIERQKISALKFVDSVKRFLVEQLRGEFNHFISQIRIAVGGDDRIIVDPDELKKKLEISMDQSLEKFSKIVDQYEDGDQSSDWPNGFVHASFPHFKVHPIEELKSEMKSQISSVVIENEKMIYQMFMTATVSGVKSVDGMLSTANSRLMSTSEVEEFFNRTISHAIAGFNLEIFSQDRSWIKGSSSVRPQYEKAMRSVQDEVQVKLGKYSVQHESRIGEWLRKISSKSIVIYQDMKRTIETSMLPCEEIVLKSEHDKAVAAMLVSIDDENDAKKFNDIAPYRDMRSSLDDIITEEFGKLEKKNIELWKIHSDEATRCGEEMNVKYTEENCSQGWFCFFKILPSYHKELSMEHLMECFARGTSRKGVVPPPTIQERVFDSWYEKELAKEAAEVKNNMWLAIISVIVPVVWIGYVRYT